MKRKMIVSLLVIICLLGGFFYIQFKQFSFPYTSVTEHFTIYYTGSDKSSIARIEEQLEENYERIVEELAPQSMPKLIIRIYPDLDSFHKRIDRPEAPDWLVGVAWKKDEIRMVTPNNPGPSHTYDSIMKVIVHEFAHCVTLNITNYPTQSMSWLYESIALYEAGQFYNPKDYAYMRNGNYPTLAELNHNNTDPKVYDIGYTIIEYIRDTWGMGSVRELVASSGNLPAVLGKGTEEFEKGWYGYVQQKYLDQK